MDWPALLLSLQLAGWTLLILLPVGVWLGRLLAWRQFYGKALIEGLLALPLVLPPTVLGYYLLVAFGGSSFVGQLYRLFAIIWAESKSFHNRLISVFSGCVHSAA